MALVLGRLGKSLAAGSRNAQASNTAKPGAAAVVMTHEKTSLGRAPAAVVMTHEKTSLGQPPRTFPVTLGYPITTH